MKFPVFGCLLPTERAISYVQSNTFYTGVQHTKYIHRYICIYTHTECKHPDMYITVCEYVCVCLHIQMYISSTKVA